MMAQEAMKILHLRHFLHHLRHFTCAIVLMTDTKTRVFGARYKKSSSHLDVITSWWLLLIRFVSVLIPMYSLPSAGSPKSDVLHPRQRSAGE